MVGRARSRPAPFPSRSSDSGHRHSSLNPVHRPARPSSTRPTPISGQPAFSMSSATAGRSRSTTSATRPSTRPSASAEPGRLHPRNLGCRRTGCAGIVTTGPAAVKPGAAGTLLHDRQPARASRSPPQNPAQGNQYVGGGGGSILVGDFGTANYNGLVTTVQHRLSSSFSLLAN